MQTALRNVFGPFVSPVLHFVLSLASGLLLLRYHRNRVSQQAVLPSEEVYFPDNLRIEKKGRIRLSLILSTILIVAIFLNKLFSERPVDMMDPHKTGSDVVPQIMFFVHRFLAGSFPYQPITGPLWGYTLTPTYLPFQWLVYIPAQLLQFDYRWIPFIALSIGMISFLYRIEKSSLISKFKWLITIFTISILACYYKFNLDENISSVEALVAAYYLFFGYSLISKKPVLIAIAIILCLLSRYALVLWLPLFFLVYFSKMGLKKSMLLALYIGLGILICYVPFLWKEPAIFINGYKYYHLATKTEWAIANWQAPGSYPYHLGRVLGFAIYFYEFAGSNIADAISFLKATHIILCLSTVIMLAIYYRHNKNRIYPVIFAIASLKIYLTFFYGFIQIPYSYLFLLPLLFDIPLLYLALTLENENKANPLLNL